MNELGYQRPSSVAAAVRLLERPGHVALGGGTTLVDLMRLGVIVPTTLVDITGVRELARLERAVGEWRLGAAVTMSQVAALSELRQEMPALVESIESAASTQIRNTATLAGNLLQAPRCVFFRDVRSPCGRRDGGDACSAAQSHVAPTMFTSSGTCRAIYPGDLAVALVALDGRVDVVGPHSRHSIPLTRFLGSGAQKIKHGELVIRLVVPRHMGTSVFVKRRDRSSFAFASASAAAWCKVDGESRVTHIRVAVGAPASVPRRLTKTEHSLLGRHLDEPAIREGAAAAVNDVDGDEDQLRWCAGVVRQALDALRERSGNAG